MSAEPRMIRTEAEEALLVRFAADALPGGTEVRAERTAAFDVFRKAGLPHRRVEEWKYTDLRTLMRKIAPAAARPSLDEARRALKEAGDTLPGLDRYRLVIVDGYFFAELSDAKALGEAGVRVESVAALLAKDGAEAAALLAPEGKAANDIAVALNAAFATDGVTVTVPDGVMLAKPLEIFHVATAAQSVTARSHVTVGAGAAVRVVESHVGPAGVAYQANASVRIDVGSRAQVAYAKLQAEGDSDHDHAEPREQQLEQPVRRDREDGRHRGIEVQLERNRPGRREVPVRICPREDEAKVEDGTLLRRHRDPG